MIYDVLITALAEDEITNNYEWWATHRSKKQAVRWYEGIFKKMEQLKENPESHSHSRENGFFPYEIRDLLFGLGRRKTHRAVFTIKDNQVVVLTVRHLAQDELQPDQIPDPFSDD